MRPLVHVEPASSLISCSLSLSYIFFNHFFIFAHIFPLSLFFLSSFFSSLFFFLFSKAELASSLVRNEPVAGCSPISPTLGLLCLTTPKAKCVMSVFQEYSANWRYQVCSWCSSHVLVHRMPLILKMVSDKEYPRVHTNRQHVLAFICLVERFFLRVRANSWQCLFMGTSSTMGVSLLQL